jgi:hypothetical protein
MSAPNPTTPPGGEPEPERERVAAALAGLQAAVRQRQGELAAGRGAAGDDFALQLAELRQREFVEEPLPVSPRRFGGLVVLVRKIAWHLGLKWHARAVWAQQNGFNQAASRLIQDLAERERETRRRAERLEARLARLEEDDARPARPAERGSGGEPPG